MSDPKLFLTVIIPAFNEENNIPLLYESLTKFLKGVCPQYEIIFVDDGSYDETFDVIKDLAKKDSRIRGFQLSRNYGSHAAITAGFTRARGDAVITLSADGQEPIEKIPEFIEKWKQGYDIVWGIRRNRDDPLFVRFTSFIFNSLLKIFIQLPGYPKYGATSFSLLDRKVVNAILQIPELNRSIIGLMGWLGFRKAEIICNFTKRQSGSSSWTLPKKIKLAIDTIVSFSYVPLKIVSLVGFIVSTLSFIYAIVIIVDYFVIGGTITGWPTLMVTVLFIGGVQLVAIGTIGEYLWRILEESRRRPLYIISDSTDNSGSEVKTNNKPYQMP